LEAALAEVLHVAPAELIRAGAIGSAGILPAASEENQELAGKLPALPTVRTKAACAFARQSVK
jgi:hypothetical protein